MGGQAGASCTVRKASYTCCDIVFFPALQARTGRGAPEMFHRSGEKEKQKSHSPESHLCCMSANCRAYTKAIRNWTCVGRVWQVWCLYSSTDPMGFDMELDQLIFTLTWWVWSVKNEWHHAMAKGYNPGLIVTNVGKHVVGQNRRTGQKVLVWKVPKYCAEWAEIIKWHCIEAQFEKKP